MYNIEKAKKATRKTEKFKIFNVNQHVTMHRLSIFQAYSMCWPFGLFDFLPFRKAKRPKKANSYGLDV